ncbi:RagB/SusD family nutrient uptake outer membrane protein [Marixanthomonas spongiae]|uniref:RagB/SusD family nutrient uptake outer membrane protein n=1 Tax=Marixanthomonas spongiae TaxID=2174845 RepID=A0A2U0HUW4_9FLAO|nr:RagB/SusD family nutrient uptake outer membrane protein [Marixanthomonas spongiae]PVW12619.1 RagB/SusD family nutrient uptake outer membrane protein [Marixanthomonas spongiae]
MKLHINTLKTVLLSFCIVALTGCSIDDVKPYYKLSNENTIRDEDSAQKVLNGVYDLGRAFDVGFFPLHLAAYGDEGLITGALSGGEGFNTNEVPVENRFLANLYNGQYKIINAANFLIQELEAGSAEGISEERKNEMISEAKFQRAFAHFNLLRYFGEYYDLSSSYGIVLRTEFALELESNPRNSVQECYDLISADLEFAAENGPILIEHFYSGSLAAKALLAKVELYKGNYLQAANLAQEVINNGEGYALETQYESIFANQFNSSEVIFAPFSGPGSEGGSGMDLISNTSYSQYLNGLADAQVGAPDDGSLTGAGENYDPRFSYAYSSATAGVNQQGKYPFQSNASSQNNTLYHLRLGEIYLIYAEAEARRDGGDLSAALNRMNDIRLRAGVDPKTLVDKPTLLEDIRKEKLLELFFENGEPLFDLVRYDILGNLDAATVKPTLNNQDKFILPIPVRVLTGNSALTQNPGY